MKRYFSKLLWHIIIIIFWIILFSHINLIIVLSGLVASVAVIWYTEQFFLDDKIEVKYPLNPFFLVSYVFFLLVEIYKAGIYMVGVIITGNINPKVIKIKTSLKSEYHRTILANSITLTPGTLTIDKAEDELLVLWMNAQTQNAERAGELIKGKLERQLLKGDKL